MEINKEFTAIYFFRKIKRSKAKDGYKNKVVNKKIHIESLIHNFQFKIFRNKAQDSKYANKTP